MTQLHPQTIYEQLLANAGTLKRKNLAIIQDICTTLFDAKAVDFSLAAVGRASERAGGVSKKALYNPTSADYQALIRAWADFVTSGQKSVVTPTKPLAEDSLLLKIPDPAVRALVAAALGERNRLRAELNVLKAASTIVVDRRQAVAAHRATVVDGVEVFEGARLTDSERRALEKAVSAAFLQGEGWTEGPHGEIRNARGRNVFDVGFSTAIRKVVVSKGAAQ